MTFNSQNALCCRKDASFGAHCTNLNEDRPILAATKMWASDSSFWKYKDSRGVVGVPLDWGPQVRVRLSKMAIFGDLSGYFSGNVRDMASNNL